MPVYYGVAAPLYHRQHMQQITLRQTLPHVFRDLTDFRSEVWLSQQTFRRGEYHLIEATSGAGKSSLCSYIYGWRGDYSGTISFDDRDIRGLDAEAWGEIRRSSLSFLFQDMRLFEELTAWENVKLKNDLTKHKEEKELRHYFDLLGIADKLDTPARILSLGQQQRVAAIRSLCQPFDFLLLDEPISHLDEANATCLASLFGEEAKRQGAGIITTSVGKHLPLSYTSIIHL